MIMTSHACDLQREERKVSLNSTCSQFKTLYNFFPARTDLRRLLASHAYALLLDLFKASPFCWVRSYDLLEVSPHSKPKSFLIEKAKGRISTEKSRKMQSVRKKSESNMKITPLTVSTLVNNPLCKPFYSSNIDKTTATNQCKRCRIFGDLDQLKDTMQKAVDWSPRRREKKK